jgi:hypothetical protein
MNTTTLLDSRRAEAQALEAQVAALRGRQDGLRQLRADGAALVEHCAEYPVLLRRHWDAFRQSAERSAFAVHQVGPFFTSFLAMAGACLKAVDAVREALEEAAQLPPELPAPPGWAPAAPDPGALGAATDALLALQSEAASLWVWLKTPMPPTQPLPTREEIRALRERGELLDIEEVIAELGEPPAEAS